MNAWRARLARAIRGPLFELEARLEDPEETHTLRVRARSPAELDSRIQAFAADLCMARGRVTLGQYRWERLEP